MDDEIKDDEILEQEASEEQEGTAQNAEPAEGSEAHSDYTPVNRFDAAAVHHLSGMYQNWFLDYASYVILERAVPHIEDGLKPVQRRILHSMKRMDDGRYNKVANIVGHTMQFHPHQPCCSSAIHRGPTLQVCAGHGVQPQDDGVADVIRRS